MRITSLESVKGKKSRIYLDGEFAFTLYQKEIRYYEMKEEMELSQTQYEQILEETVLRRAKLRCLNLLQAMDRTEFQMRQKLRQAEYPEEVVERAIAYAKEYRYVDDRRYAEQYIRCFREKKSRQQIMQELQKRGIDRNTVQEALNESEPVDECKQILKWMEKKRFDPENADYKECQKFCAFLARKGFSAENIRRICTEAMQNV